MEHDSNPSVGGQIRAIRAQLGMSQLELADALGVTNVTVSRWERDRARPERAMLERLVRAERSGRAALSASASRGNLPIPYGPFVGRITELAALPALLTAHRFVTLIGPGGCGKSRLAAETALTIIGEGFDGVWWLDLAPLGQDDQVAAALARLLGVREATGQSTADRIVSHCAGKRLLLLFDNCEHLVQGCRALAESLVTGCPDVFILATSRRALAGDGEHVHTLQPLAIEAEDGTAGPAIYLFRELARRPIDKVDANDRDVATLCRRLDGLPLAIEIAAARTTVLTVIEIRERLDRSLSWRRDSDRNRISRGQSLEDTLAWSYDLLTPDDRTLFRMLGCFSGSFTLSTIESVAGGDILAGIERLTRDSLLTVRASDAGTTRYRLLETVRSFALERLTLAGELDAVGRRHAIVFRDVANELASQMHGPRQLDALRGFDEEQDNIRAALTWAEQTGDTTLMLELTAALWRLWQARGELIEARRWMTAAGALETVAPASVAQAETATGLASIAVRLGDRVTASRAITVASTTWLALNDAVGVARTDFLAGHLALRQGDHAAARDAINRGLATHRSHDAQEGIATGLNLLGQVESALGDESSAESRFVECWSLVRQAGDLQTESIVLANMGEVLRRLGRPREAVGYLERSLDLSRQLGHDEGIAVKLMNLAELRAETGDRTRAIELARESVAVAREIGFRGLIADANYVLGVIEASAEPPIANSLRAALAIYHELGNQTDAASTLEALAMIASRTAPDVAARWLGAAASIRETEGAEPYSPRRYKRWLAAVRRQLPTAEFTRYWEIGAAMAPEQAILEGLHLDFGASVTSVKRPVARNRLTPRQQQILALVAVGYSNREVAQELGISERTVERHLTAIYASLRVERRSGAIAHVSRLPTEPQD